MTIQAQKGGGVAAPTHGQPRR